MTEQDQPRGIPTLDRLPTGISGLDDITGGGLPTRRTLLITGEPGTGKTTMGNQLAFAHAARGGVVLIATLLTESHDLMIENMQSFGFFDADMVGRRIRYLSVLAPIMESGLDAAIDLLRQEVRSANATLLVIDGTAVAAGFTPSTFDLQRFAHRLESQSALLGCTTVLLTSTGGNGADPLWAHVNGVVLLTNRPRGSRHVRMLEVVKLRGVRYVNGSHEFAITEAGLTVFPRLESMVGGSPRPRNAEHGVGTGVAGMDAMLGGGLMPLSSTLVLGTPGAGKTILGLHFLAEGAERGERGLLVGFNETADDICSTAERIGLDLRRHVDSGMVQVHWNAPLELSVDNWAWQVLGAVEEQSSSRIYIDALTDVQRLITATDRTPLFVTALVNALRNRGVTSMIAAELDAYTDERLTIPVPAASAAMDNGIVLRHVEFQGELRRLVAVPKARQAMVDPSIREVHITDQGMTIELPLPPASGLLTGRASETAETSEDTPT